MGKHAGSSKTGNRDKKRLTPEVYKIVLCNIAESKVFLERMIEAHDRRKK